jgi:hypothetical protein
MAFFKPQTARSLAKELTAICAKWDKIPKRQRASGEWIDPDEPVVIWVRGQDVNGCIRGDLDADDEVHLHVASYGGGGDRDEDGNECGHDGVQLGTMEIDQSEFLSNGRRVKR